MRVPMLVGPDGVGSRVAVAVMAAVAVTVNSGRPGDAVGRPIRRLSSRPGQASHTPAARTARISAMPTKLQAGRNQFILRCRRSSASCMRARPRARPPGESWGHIAAPIIIAVSNKGARPSAYSG